MTKDELKLAFQKAFQMGQDYWYYANHEFESYNKKSDAIRAKFNEMVKETIEEALAQPEQEPVAWMNDMGTHIDLNVSGRGIPLYTTPPQRKPLTDEEIWKFWWARPEVQDGENDSMEAEFVAAVRAVLAAHGIKE